jgi:hypothetical protein
MTEFSSVGDDYARHTKLMLAIDQAFNENEDLLENIASDYDDGFVSYSEEETD